MGCTCTTTTSTVLERLSGRQRRIVLTRTALGYCLGDGRIGENRIVGFTQGILAEVPIASLTIAGNRVVRAEVGVVVSAEPMGTLRIDANDISDIVGAGIRVRSGDAGRVSALGNSVSEYRRGPGVLIECPRSECIVADNHVQPSSPTDAPAILVMARTVAATANQLSGRGVRLELQVDAGARPLATVLGNITGGDILLNAMSLAAPWEPFNHRFVV